MKKPRKISSKALESLKLQYTRPVSVFEDFSGADYIRRIASSVGSAFDVKLELRNAPTQVNMDTQVVTLNETHSYKYGDDYAVGLVLHEVGHLKNTPRNVAHRDGWHHELHNLFEDVRMEAIVKKEYAGAHYFIDAINKPALEKITEAAHRPVSDDYPQSRQQIEQCFYTIIQHAIARAYGADTAHSFPPKLERWSDAAELISQFMLESETATADQCITIATQARDYMEQFINPPKPTPKPAAPQGVPMPNGEKGEPSAASGTAIPAPSPEKKDGKETPKGTPEAKTETPPEVKKEEAPAKPKYDIRPAQDREQLLRRAEVGGTGYGTYETGEERDQMNGAQYERADAQARLYASNLRRKIIAKLRANDRSKIVNGQRRGRLNKKVIAKAALNNPRLYQRRLQPQKRRYVASVILDTSGSMWNRGDGRIDNAMQASAMFVRTLRALNIPTALSIYGSKSSERVAHSDRYLVPETSREMAEMSRAYYRAGHTETATAIATQLPKLQRAAHGREQLLIIITDGDVSYHTAQTCKELIKKAQKRSIVHPMVFYVEARVRNHLLSNPEHERYIKDAAELPKAAAELMANIEFHG